jgi:hypothetical protein
MFFSWYLISWGKVKNKKLRSLFALGKYMQGHKKFQKTIAVPLYTR